MIDRSLSLFRLILQLWEEDYVSDGGGTCEHHDEAVYAYADSACWRHSAFHGFYEVVIDVLCLAARLFLETLTLEDGVI